MENYQDYQLQQQQNYRLDKDMLMDKTKQKRKYFNIIHACQGNQTLSRILMRKKFYFITFCPACLTTTSYSLFYIFFCVHLKRLNFLSHVIPTNELNVCMDWLEETKKKNISRLCDFFSHFYSEHMIHCFCAYLLLLFFFFVCCLKTPMTSFS